MRMQLLWVGGAIGTVTAALSIVKLANHFFQIGFAGVPGFIFLAYTKFVTDIRRWLLEVPFDLHPPEWALHAAIVWFLFVGSNLRFLSNSNHGQSLYRGIGDVGRGTRTSLSGWALRAMNLSVSLTGPLFSTFVLVMWLANRKGGPTGVGHWGDNFMISNRTYTVRISRTYLVILLLAPLTAAAFLAWGAAESVPDPVQRPPRSQSAA
jgi:hypothetical protein